METLETKAEIGTQSLKERRGRLIFALSRSTRYCAKRAHFYAAWMHRTTLTALIGAAVAVFAGFFNIAPLAVQIGAALIMTCGVCGIAFNWHEKAHFWAIQRVNYGKLEERFKRLGENMTVDEFNALKADMATLEADEREGATRNALMTICHNEECNARNANDHKVTLRAHQRLFAHIVDLPPVVWR